MGRPAVLISNWETRSAFCLELKGAALKRGIGLGAEGKLQKHDGLRDIQSPREARSFAFDNCCEARTAMKHMKLLSLS